MEDYVAVKVTKFILEELRNHYNRFLKFVHSFYITYRE